MNLVPYLRSWVSMIRSPKSSRGIQILGTGALVCLLLMGPTPSEAATETWSGVVNLTADKFVPAGDTLVIQPGTQVIASHRQECADEPKGEPEECVELNIAGRLEAAGTYENPIVFASDVGGPNDWAGIAFLGGGNGYVNYARVRNAKVGILVDEAGDSPSNPSVEISYTIFEDNLFHGVWIMNDSHSWVHHNTFRNHGSQTDGSVMKVEKAGADAQPLIENNIFYNNAEAAITVDMTNPTILHNTTYGGQYGVYIREGGSVTNPVIRNNIFKDFEFWGIGCLEEGSDLVVPEPVIEYNNIQSDKSSATGPVGFGTESWQPCEINCSAGDPSPDNCAEFTNNGNISHSGSGSLFTDPQNANFTLPASSPSVDAGGPWDPAGSCSGSNPTCCDCTSPDADPPCTPLQPGTTVRCDQGAYGGPNGNTQAGFEVPFGTPAIVMMALGALGGAIAVMRRKRRHPSPVERGK